jgi:hypothetical protein
MTLTLKNECKCYGRILLPHSRTPFAPFMWKKFCLKIEINRLSAVMSSQSSNNVNRNACGKQKKYGLNTAHRLARSVSTTNSVRGSVGLSKVESLWIACQLEYEFCLIFSWCVWCRNECLSEFWQPNLVISLTHTHIALHKGRTA